MSKLTHLNFQTIATYFSQVMAAVGANTAGPGMVFFYGFLHYFSVQTGSLIIAIWGLASGNLFGSV
jgi:hypothetical protein